MFQRILSGLYAHPDVWVGTLAVLLVLAVMVAWDEIRKRGESIQTWARHADALDAGANELAQQNEQLRSDLRATRAALAELRAVIAKARTPVPTIVVPAYHAPRAAEDEFDGRATNVRLKP